MKPFLLVSSDFVTTGGMDRANHALATFLARQGHPVHLVAHRAAADLAALPGVILHRVPKPADSYFLGEFILGPVGEFWRQRLAVDGVRVVVNGGNCSVGDVNWVHYVHGAYQAVAVESLMRRLKQQIVHRFFCRAERKSLRRARLVLANSQRTRADLISRLAIPPERIEVVYYGVDPQQFRPATPDERIAIRNTLGWPSKRRLVAFVGALGDRRKGFDTLFGAWEILCAKESWDADLVVIGSGAELSAWCLRAGIKGLSDRIRFMGFREDVPSLLRACDALVAPTRYEAYGLGVHEALCCGLPAIVSRSAGVAERYPPDMRDLLIENPDDSNALARQLWDWRERADVYRVTTEAFGTVLRNYSWDDMAARIMALMEEDGNAGTGALGHKG